MSHVIYVCGAGGKTTWIRREAERAAADGQSVFVTTSTHMLRELSTCLTAKDVLEQLKKGLPVRDGAPDPKGQGRPVRGGAPDPKRKGIIVRGGAPDPKNKQKIIGFDSTDFRRLSEQADLTLVEADGARHMLVKTPKLWEPVIGDDADEIVVLYSSRAVGQRLIDACYNWERAAEILKMRPEDILTEGRIQELLQEGYVKPLAAQFPGVPIRLERGARRVYHLILLAAGFSSRFGSNKLLYELDGKPMYRHLADRLLEIVEERTVVFDYAAEEHNRMRNSAKEARSIVPDAKAGEQAITADLGRDASDFRCDLTVVTQYDEIRESLAGSKAAVVINPAPERGISSSLQCALKDLEEHGTIGGDDFYVVFTADQPFLRKETIEGFLEVLMRSSRRLGCVSDGTQLRSPCAFGQEYMEELMALKGDRGGKKILRKHPEEILIFAAENAEELEDIDTL